MLHKPDEGEATDGNALDESELSDSYKSGVKHIREMVKVFKRSAKKEEALLEKVSLSQGKPLKPILDVRTRWNSLYEMISRALSILPKLKETLGEYDHDIKLSDEEVGSLKMLERALKPCKILSNTLCEKIP